MRYLREYKSIGEVIGTRASTPFVGTVYEDKPVFAYNTYGSIIKLVTDGDYFKPSKNFPNNNEIFYNATYKLSETDNNYNAGLHINAFNTSIKSHTFEDGNGSIVFNGDVYTISNSAFYRCSNLTNISFPNCTYIGGSAFYSCYNLTTASFPNCTSIGYWAFYYCSNLTSISFPNCTYISGDAFHGCRNLTTASFPKCTSIDYWAFATCTNLTTVSFPNCTTIGNSAFSSCYFAKSNFNIGSMSSTGSTYGATLYDTEDNGVLFSSTTAMKARPYISQASFDYCTSIYSYAFTGCSNLTTADFPNCTYINTCAFQNCSNLTTASFPNCTYIAGDAFSGCSNLTTADFPKCTSIYSYAFYGCSNLTNISFPNCTMIGGNAFYNCYILKSNFNIGSMSSTGSTYGATLCDTEDNGVLFSSTTAIKNKGNISIASFDYCTAIYSSAFQNCYSLITADFPACTSIGQSAFNNCTNLTSISFPNCTTIGTYAFRYCSNLTSVSFPSCTSIGGWVFYSCSNLTTADFPSCTTIGSGAFQDCSKLTNISFPTCKTISYAAFFQCFNLTNVSFPNCTIIGSEAFAGCSNLTNISFPNCTTIGSNAFAGCSNLTSISFPSCTYISNYAFTGCYNLTTLYLLGSSVVSLVYRDAFYSTPIESGTGSIYVPASLYNNYISATNWIYFSSAIHMNYIPSVYKSLTITADDVRGNSTNTKIHYTFITDGTYFNGDAGTDVELTGTATSDEFEQNTSTTDTVTRTITYTSNGLTATTTITQGVYIPSDLVVGTNWIDSSDTTKTYKTWGSRNGRLYSFMPETTKSYTFTFNDNVTGGSAIDTFGYLLDSTANTQLVSDDDSAGSNADPKFTYNCTAGVKYYVLITPYQTGSTSTVKGNLVIS